MDSVVYDDPRLMELAVYLYLQGYSRDVLIKKLLEKVNNPAKVKRFIRAVEKTARINKDRDNQRNAELVQRYKEKKQSARQKESVQEAGKASERNVDDDYDYCPPLY